MFELTPVKKRLALLTATALASTATALYFEHGKSKTGAKDFTPANFVFPPGGADVNQYKNGIWEVGFLNQNREINRTYIVSCVGHTLVEQIVNLTSSIQQVPQPSTHINSNSRLYTWANNSWCEDEVFTDGDLKTHFDPKPIVPPHPSPTATV